MWDENYQRVIPRDFFNEALLLKSMGLLSLKIHDNNLPNGVEISIEEDHERVFEYVGFNIKLDGEASLLYIDNYNVFINKNKVFIGSVYNSKLRYPLVVFYQNVEIEVFDDEGNFTENFITTFRKKKVSKK